LSSGGLGDCIRGEGRRALCGHRPRTCRASLVALAEHLGTIEIATLDERHFRAVDPWPDARHSGSYPPTLIRARPRRKRQRAAIGQQLDLAA
jgi:hypothetical protein